MNVVEAIESRRSIKHYDPEFEIPKDHVNKLEECIRASPTAFNTQNWRIVKVEDKELRKKIREAAWGQAQVTDASLLYIFCGDLNAYEKDPKRYWVNAPEEIQNYMVENIGNYYRDKPEVQRDEAMRSCGLAAMSLMLAAKGLGYDSCPMDGFDFDAVAKLINLPATHVISMFVVVGKATQPAREKGGYIPNEEVFIPNTF